MIHINMAGEQSHQKNCHQLSFLSGTQGYGLFLRHFEKPTVLSE